MRRGRGSGAHETVKEFLLSRDVLSAAHRPLTVDKEA
jgi:hypothetical protein